MSIIFSRQHPVYQDNKDIWKRSEAAYSGGRSYIDTALIKHVTETLPEFEERKERSYYFNYPRSIAQRITQYSLSIEPQREGADADIVDDWNRKGLRTNEVMRQASTILNVYGLAWLYIDMPYFEGTLDVKRAKEERLRPFTDALKPLSVPDWAFGDDGRLLWAIVEFKVTKDENPLEKRVDVTRRLLWMRDEWHLFEKGNKAETIASGANPTGVVPLVMLQEPDGFGIEANHWFEDVVRASDAILNNGSEAQMNIVKQMFGLLVIADSFARDAKGRARGERKGKDDYMLEISRSAAAIESPEEKGITRYISPSGVETAAIYTENANLKQELYDVVGLAIQSRSREAQTAESKAWDFKNVSQFMCNRADLLEQAEIKAWEIMSLWDKSVKVPAITYNRDFAVKDLATSIQALLQMDSMSGNGIEFQKQIKRALLELLDGMVSISDEDKKKILEEITKFQPAPIPDMSMFGRFGRGIDKGGDNDDQNDNENKDHEKQKTGDV